MSSRVLLPDLKTASSLRYVSSPSGVNDGAGPATRATALSALMSILPAGNAPFVSVISPDLKPPT